jgi:hypothetical protein
VPVSRWGPESAAGTIRPGMVVTHARCCGDAYSPSLVALHFSPPTAFCTIRLRRSPSQALRRPQDRTLPPTIAAPPRSPGDPYVVRGRLAPDPPSPKPGTRRAPALDQGTGMVKWRRSRRGGLSRRGGAGLVLAITGELAEKNGEISRFPRQNSPDSGLDMERDRSRRESISQVSIAMDSVRRWVASPRLR